jgi:PDDEXK-like domain of unknown function (DUF3799)
MKPGIYYDMDSRTYFGDPCPEPSLSQSLAKIVLEQSLLHAEARFLAMDNDPKKESYDKAKAIGDAAHKLMLGRGKDIDVLDFDAFRSAAAKAARDASFGAGRTPILTEHFDAAVLMWDSARAQLRLHQDSDAFTSGHAEVALIWQDDGIWCRSLIDWLHDDLRTVDDLKSSAMSMAPHVIGHRAEAAGWHVQAAFIERGLDVLDPAGAGRRRFRFIAQEQDAPYALTVMRMDEQWLTMGRKKVQAAMALWRQAIKTGKWPGYPLHSVTPEYPGYREKAWLERELSGEFEPMNDTTLTMAG